MTVEQFGGAALHHAKAVLGLGFGRVGADLDVEGAGNFRLGSPLRLRRARGQAGIVGFCRIAGIALWLVVGSAEVDGSGTVEAMAKLGFFDFAGDGVT